MKLQKQTSLWSGIIALAALILSIAFSCQEYSLMSNIFIGLFSSATLICVTAFIAYFSERDDTILALYHGCYKFMNELNLNLTLDGQIDLDKVRINLSTMMNTYTEEIYYHVCVLAGLCKKSKLRKIIMKIWCAARNIYLLVDEDDNYIMKIYCRDIELENIQNYKFKYAGDSSINYIKNLQDALEDLKYHMNYYHCRKGTQEEQADAD